VAHFDPIEFPVYGEGTYVGLGLSLPRDLTKGVFPWRPLEQQIMEDRAVGWEDLLEQARKRLTQVRADL
jgi:hypothetical protein